ncbi:MAG: serine/threonine protein kinase [Microcystis aeruginosa Ma_MB_F_20061100_S19]|uniref:Putative ATPase (AAA+ superfamily) n=1 Tax=Microcystis aeruginosa SPC777 TaxID=482300 RepID=S3JHH7_MICAE|nr:AAA-like domain-containing protein [Microcystis aeruginosa]NCR97275.1 serine/threonine protein kinase [Microcystis aeruginosa L311-01]OCY15681.1 MAG: serine/threonine protein kinase [Microcystis aeruginosa CACIAM 03]TRU12928.1 MAG: serine/threonine protein kinase [Microcystis aeruginosa Ma_MB_F_20061100_S19D]TRU14002.1 MAG: serine/threonine protein kinase [Microcystis aeruginosa Ma_MB_F_20061100_S19]EPF19637.1 putative ATPase (AAA+ superfamily) [Microcystis aeruginosa SPC777]
MKFEEIQEILNRQLLKLENRCLNDTEQLLLRGLWQKKNYQEIAQENGYSSGYLANVVAPGLYDRVSQLIGEPINKKNFLSRLQSHFTNSTSLQYCGQEYLQNERPEYPDAPIPYNSYYYLKRTKLEAKIIEEIGQSGALVRIKAPNKWGKTSLLLTILEACQQQFGYQIVSLDLQKADQDIIANFNKFLRWICRNCARQLNLEAKLDDYWDEDIGIKMSWTIYFEEYILREIKQPLVLALDGVHRVFEHPKVAEDFLPLIRACYEESKRSPLWQKLRLIIVQSTESYVSLRLEQSPFNVGLPIELQGFGQEQVAELAKKYQLNELATNEIQQLIDLVGGHPALIHLAIYHLSQEQITMPDLIKSATTSTGIYSSHLQLHWVTLQKQPELAGIFQQICQGNQPMIVDPIIAYKLNSMGLIKLRENKAIVSCQLYQKYFISQYTGSV